MAQHEVEVALKNEAPDLEGRKWAVACFPGVIHGDQMQDRRRDRKRDVEPIQTWAFFTSFR